MHATLETYSSNMYLRTSTMHATLETYSSNMYLLLQHVENVKILHVSAFLFVLILAVLVIYIHNALHMNKSNSKAVYHAFSMVSYFYWRSWCDDGRQFSIWKNTSKFLLRLLPRNSLMEI